MSEQINQPSIQEINTELSRTRTALAMDRTLLAWVRTSLSLIAFGFTLARFVHDLIAKGELHGVDGQYPRELGIVLMVLGIMGLLGGTYDHWRSLKRLKQHTVMMNSWSASLVVALILAVLSLILMINIGTDWAPDPVKKSFHSNYDGSA